MARLLLVRHGESTWNATGRWQGWADPPLSDLGRAQAAMAVNRARGVESVVSSDLQRARETGQIIATALGLGHHVDPDLRERDVGELTGLTRPEIEQRWPLLFDGSSTLPEPPGGEATDHFVGRVLSALRRVAGSAAGGEVLVVSHGGVVRNLERHLGLTPDPCPNLGGLRLDVDGDRVEAGGRVLLVNPDDVAVTVPRQL
ncbi:MAG: histidine phosphatase family protein [Acidimicrobiia bacterium]|nr:histidine phosphatase family protein [Acidimicrobiia bacterium]